MTPPPVSIARVLDAALEHRPSAVALTARSGSLTYAQLETEISRAAGGLWEWGIRPGDRVVGALDNDLDAVIAFHAVMRIGAIWVGVNTALAAPERMLLINRCDARVVLAHRDLASDARRMLAETRCSTMVLVVDPDDPTCDWSRLTAAGHTAPSVAVDPHAPAGIAYTSGTTGEPTGIVHSQHNLLLPGAVLVATRGYDHTLVKGDCLPLTILNMMVLTTLLTAQAQGTCVVMDRRDAAGIVEWIDATATTVFNGVPTQLWDIVRNSAIGPSSLRSLREVWCGGSDCPAGLRDAFAERFGLDIRATYGLTEAPTIVTIDPPGGEWRPGSSGQILPHLRIETVDRRGAAVAADEVGELCIGPARTGRWARSWTPMLGTFTDGEVVDPPAGHILTGDLGTVDEGWVSIVDRRKLMILRGGANVYPAEVERALLTADGVASVAVFGIPDDRLGERVAALVELSDTRPEHAPPTADELAAHCSDQLARYKIPQTWGFVDALPRNAMGKIVRADLPALLTATHATP